MSKHLVEKIVAWSPLKNSLAKALVALNLRFLAEHPNTACQNFKHILDVLQKSRWKEPRKCDELLIKYQTLVREREFLKHSKAFDFHKDRLDDFYFDTVGLHRKEGFKGLHKVFIMLLSLSHGQADNERGFSVNKDMLKPNMQEKTLVAKRMIHSAISASGVKSAADFTIPRSMRESCKPARSRYGIYLDDQKKEKKNIKKKRKNDEIGYKLDAAVTKKLALDKDVMSLTEEADAKAKKAAAKRDMSILEASNALRDRAHAITKKDLQKVTEEIEALKHQQAMDWFTGIILYWDIALFPYEQVIWFR